MKIEGDFLIDTNILIYALDKYSGHFEFSRSILENNENIFLPHKSLTEFVSVMSKIGRYDIVEKELDKLSLRFSIIYPDKYSAEIFSDLIMKYRPVGNRVYDFEIVSVMLSTGIKRIATANIRDFAGIKEIEVIKV